MKKHNELILPGLVGVLLALFGLAMVLWPGVLVNIIVPLVGTILILVGAQGIGYAIVMSKKLPDPGIRLAQSLVSLLVGLVFLLKHDLSAVFISILFGLYVLVTAAIGLAQTFGRFTAKKPFLGGILENALQLVLGLLLLFSPFTQGSLWIRVLGIHFVLAAIGMLRWLVELVRNKPRCPEEKQGDEHKG